MHQENFSGIPATLYSEKIISDSLETQTGRYLWDNGIADGLCGLFGVFSSFYCTCPVCTMQSQQQRAEEQFYSTGKKEKTPGAKMSMLEIRNIHFISLAEWHLHQSRQINCKNKATL